jgi:Na+/H+-dicarboxylate symporter
MAMQQTPTWLQRYQRVAMNPITIVGCILLGVVIGCASPALSKHLAGIGAVYLDLLKMIVLPFMVSAIIFSLLSLYRDGKPGALVLRLAAVFLVFSTVAACVAGAASLVARPGANLSDDERTALGHIVGAESDRANIDMVFRAADETPDDSHLKHLTDMLIPANVFATLASGDTLKSLVFALLFGFAIAQVPGQVSDSMGRTLETIYRACQTLSRWINLPVPLVLVCMTAGQIGDTGLQPVQAMASFVAVFLAVCAGLLALAVVTIAHRSGAGYFTVAGVLREAFVLGVATNNSAVCMPAMVDALADRLNFLRSKVELLVPLTVSLLRTGAIAYFVCGALFVAALYDRSLSPAELCMVAGLAMLSGLASTGMGGILTISLIGTVCKFIGLPFEAVFLLFVAVDPICAMGRTAVTVIVSCAAVAAACPNPAAASREMTVIA